MTKPLECATLAWDSSLSTGVDSLDEQHQSLFECFVLLETAAEEKNMLRTCHVLEKLAHYVRVHFVEEELLMRQHGCPDIDAHILEHRSFSNKLHELRATYLARDISVDLVTVLRGWISHHVAHTDMKYVPYLTQERRRKVAANEGHYPARATSGTSQEGTAERPPGF